MSNDGGQKSERITLIVCSHNPRPDLIRCCLAAIGNQTLSPEEFELIIVDNNSSPPLVRSELEEMCGRRITLLREERSGLTFARVNGFQAARHDTIAFADDDNELFPEYLEQALIIADSEPNLGVFGGRCLAKLEHEISPFKQKFLPFLGVKDMGNEPLTGSGKEWGPHEPIGAGIVVRRPVANAYVEFVEKSMSPGQLGRTGSQLLSGEDSLISRLADNVGFQCGYRPELQLYHFVESRRLNWHYLMRLMKGHGISYVRLSRLNGATFDPKGRVDMYKELARNFLYRAKTDGLDKAVMHLFWDVGFFEEINRHAD